MENQQELFVKMTLDAWNGRRKLANDTFSLLTDEQLRQQVSPGKNTGVYLLGHLTAVYDAMLPLLFKSKRLHPELEEVFVKNPDRSGLQKPTIYTLREYWDEINLVLVNKFAMTKTHQWFERHHLASEEDFAKEPHRNKLSIVINQTSHLAHHLGQLFLLK